MSKADTFLCRANRNGTLNFSPYNRIRLKEWMKENHGRLMKLTAKHVESAEQRGWFEGGLIPFITYHQDNMDHHEADDRHKVREWLKLEFNADMVAIGGKTHMIAQSTKGVLNEGIIENILAWCEDQGMKVELLDPKIYKKWRDEIRPFGGPDNFIDYLVKIKKLP